VESNRKDTFSGDFNKRRNSVKATKPKLIADMRAADIAVTKVGQGRRPGSWGSAREGADRKRVANLKKRSYTLSNKPRRGDGGAEGENRDLFRGEVKKQGLSLLK